MSKGRSSIDMKNARTAGNANAIFGDVQRHRPIGVGSFLRFCDAGTSLWSQEQDVNVGPVI